MKKKTSWGVNAALALPLAGVILAFLAAGPLFAQQGNTGFPEDWTHHHVVFSNPGTIADAEKSRSFDKWYKTVNDPRYIIQQLKRRGQPPSGKGNKGTQETTPLQRDWSASLGGAGVAPGMYPAKWQFSATATPNCSDYVVFPVDKAGASGTQPNIVGLTNLYNTTCTPTAPTVMFSYYVGTGTVQTSPVLGPSANQVAYVESVAGGSKFHVLKGAGTGASNGTILAPVAPGTGNSAADTALTLSGGVMVTRSSPFYDSVHDVAYVGDDTGKLHQFTGVFNGTPAETTSGWPVTVSSQTTKTLSPPVLDYPIVYVGDASGYLYGVNVTNGAVTTSGHVGAGLGIVDGVILDSFAGTLYAFVGESVADPSNSAVIVFNISSGNIPSGSTGTVATLGTDSAGVPVYIGSLDNIYYTSAISGQPAGNLYVCANPGGNPTLYRVPISYSSGTVLGTAVTVAVLASSAVGCSPASEFYNASTSKDWLFVGVPGNSCGASAGATLGGCVLSFNITSVATATASVGPWTPSMIFALDAKVVDTNGYIQECTGGECGVSGSDTSGTTTPAWTGTTTYDGGLAANADVGTVTCLASGTCSGATISLKNTTASSIPWSCAGTNCGSVTMSPASGTNLGTGATGTIFTNESAGTADGQTITIGSIAYTYESAFTAGASQTAPQILGTCSGCHPQTAQNLFAAITGLASNCTYSGATVCYSPFPLTWTYQSVSNGQTTAAAPTGTSGIIIDNDGTSTGEANIYFGTLSGAGQTNAAVKMTQAALQ